MDLSEKVITEEPVAVANGSPSATILEAEDLNFKRRLEMPELQASEDYLEIDADEVRTAKRVRRSSIEEDDNSSSTRDSRISSDGEGPSSSICTNSCSSPSNYETASEFSGSSPQKKSRFKYNPFKRTEGTKELMKKDKSFLQDMSCTCTSKLPKCLECNEIQQCRSKSRPTQPHLSCRFYGFRKLRYSKTRRLTFAGFSDPDEDPLPEDRNLWLPAESGVPMALGVDMCKALLDHVGDQFCELIQQEQEAFTLNLNEKTKSKPLWKRIVPTVRDMCDVCKTTLFNYHWVCGTCGFVVCIACYKSKKTEVKKDPDEEKENDTSINAEQSGDADSEQLENDEHEQSGGEIPDLVENRDSEHSLNTSAEQVKRDQSNWSTCTTKRAHVKENLLLTQVMAGGVLEKINKIFHLVREQWKIPQECGCSEVKKYQQQKQNVQKKGSSCDSDEEDDSCGGFTFIKSSCGDSDNESEGAEEGSNNGMSNSNLRTDLNEEPERFNQPLQHFVREGGPSRFHRKQLPTRSFTWKTSQKLFPDVSHSWLCSGQLLKLEDPKNPKNMGVFQEVWKRGQPVLVSNINDQLDAYLWTPKAFGEEFGKLHSDLVNCLTGKTIHRYSLKPFWEGFDCISNRLVDNDGVPMLLKLKDWPANQDFADLSPNRFNDLMAALPLSEYTSRVGRLNLAARLPDTFVKPDLGPKMYIAYGSGLHLDKGTTNLHLDISDAVNVMVYVGVPTDVDNTEHLAGVREAICDSDCEQVTVEAVLDKIEKAGALWHIYKSSDADKIRDFLNKVAKERKNWLEPDHDPIHDQSWYLDKELRKRLMAEYGVRGYPILQCHGDAIFIPAGAPHQVRNLNNCIKIAEDFVSPENISHCFDLTEEFRKLPDTHQNHEDKLQIRNIIYHAVKDALAVLSHSAIDLVDQ